MVTLSWQNIDHDGAGAYILRREALNSDDEVLATRLHFLGNTSRTHRSILGLEKPGLHTYRLDFCTVNCDDVVGTCDTELDNCVAISLKKMVTVAETPVDTPNPPMIIIKDDVSSGNDLAGYQVSFSNDTGAFNLYELLENGEVVLSHTISGDAAEQSWTQNYFAEQPTGVPGSLIYQVRACNGTECKLSEPVGLNQPPIAHLALNPAVGRIEAGVTQLVFSAAGSSDPEGGVLSFSWLMGDGTQLTGQTVSHIYEDPGAHTVVLTVIDEEGLTGRAAFLVGVSRKSQNNVAEDPPQDSTPPEAESSSGGGMGLPILGALFIFLWLRAYGFSRVR